MMNEVINVIIADDHPVVVLGISKQLEAESDICVTATACDVKNLMQVLELNACNVLVCDFAFSDDGAQDGIRLMERLRQRFPQVMILLLTMHSNPVLVQRVLSIGVSGFISKSSSTLGALPAAIRMIYSGRTYLDPVVAGMLISQKTSDHEERNATTITSLTSREFEVIRNLLKGMSVSEIARETHRSIKTISAQKNRAMKKIGAHNDVEIGECFRRISESDRHE
jgi:two-component system, NarL family, captular synthesis response regulator RcsB